MTRSLCIEWRYFNDGTALPIVARPSGLPLGEFVTTLRTELASHDVQIRFDEVRLPRFELTQCERLFLNGSALEQLTGGSPGAMASIGSCACSPGRLARLRTTGAGSPCYELDEEIVRTAVAAVLGITSETMKETL